jgi:SAM-dependent methyltransferase
VASFRFLRGVPGARAVYRTFGRLSAWVRALREFDQFRRHSTRERPDMIPAWRDRLLMLDNRTAQTPFDRHYVYHTAWALRRLQADRPAAHVDVSSSVYFVALGSAVVPMTHYDYRPLPLDLPGLSCARGDLLALPLPDQSVPSLSCMHVIEHVGLGRYGDPLDARGDIKAARELMRVLAPGGRLYVVVPVGRRRVCFNGHRVYDFSAVRELFATLDLEESALIRDGDGSGLVINPPREEIDAQDYGCGCFVFVKAKHG